MIEFSVPFQIISPLGTYDAINNESTEDGRFWRTVPEECDAGAALRVNDEDLPQTDGREIHPHFRSGYMMQFSLQPFDGGGYASDGARREMWEELNGHLEAIRNADGRIQWTPSEYEPGDRILDGVRLLTDAKASGGTVPTKKVTFQVGSRFPYYIDEDEQEIDLDATITNPGNAPFAPVIKVTGPVTTGFTLANAADLDLDGNPKQIVYDTSLPGAATIAGGGDYAEIDFFRCTITLNGAVSFLSEGIDWANSDFFRILPGDNDVSISGDGTAVVLFNPSWA